VRRDHRLALAVAATLAAIAHALVLGAWPARAVDRMAGLRAPGSLQVRQITGEAAMDRAPTARANVVAPPSAPTRPATEARAIAPPRPLTPASESGSGTPQATATQADDAPPAIERALATPPTYRTTPPPPLSLHYAISRDGRTGDARLDWRRGEDGHYEIELRAVSEGPGLPLGTSAPPGALTPHWTSRGSFDAAGIAPERFAVARRGRERHAANFQREAGIVSYAGPARTWPLADGAQDRLSWMIQLAAVLQANPALGNAGAEVSMMVVGAHGDADVWTFTVLGREAVEGPGGETFDTLLLQREARHAHDPQVQVWVSPRLHHLPLRLRLTRRGGGESTEFRLRALQAP